MREREKCDSSVSTGIFTLTDCLKAVAVRGGAEQTAVHHSYIPTVTTSRATSRAQLQPASHSIPIRPGLISISVVTAARGLGGWLGPHSPSVRAQTEPHLPPSQPSHRSRPKLFSYFSCDSPSCTLLCPVHTLPLYTLYTPSLPSYHSANSYHLASSQTALLSLFNLPSTFHLPLKHQAFLSVSLFI